MVIDLLKEERARNFQIVLSTGGGGSADQDDGEVAKH